MSWQYRKCNWLKLEKNHIIIFLELIVAYVGHCDFEENTCY